MSIPSRTELLSQEQLPAPPSASSYTPALNSNPDDILAELGFAPTAAAVAEEDPDVLADEQAAALEGLAEAPVAAVAPAATPDPAVVPPPVVEPAPDAKLQALIEREARTVERETAIREFQPQLDAIQTRLDAYEAAKGSFKLDPISYLRALDPDLDFDSLAKTLWYEKLGTAAPLEHRIKQEVRADRMEVHKTRAELEAERKRIAEDHARMQAEASEAQYVDTLRGYLSSVPSELGLVQHLSKSKPDVAVRMFRDAARMIAPGLGRTPTAEEAAKAVQKYLDEIGYVAPAPTPAEPAQTPTASAPAQPPTTTIRNSHSAVQPGRIPPNENDPRVLRRNANRALAEALGDPSLADLPVD